MAYRRSARGLGQDTAQLERRLPIRVRTARQTATPALNVGEVVIWEDTAAETVSLLVRLGQDTLTLNAGSSTLASSPNVPVALGSVSAGTGAYASRYDHIHPMPSAADVGAAAAAHTHGIDDLSDLTVNAGPLKMADSQVFGLGANYNAITWENWGVGTVNDAFAYLFTPSASLNTGVKAVGPPATYYKWDPHLYVGNANPPPNMLMYGGLTVGYGNYMGLYIFCAPASGSGLPTTWWNHPQWRGRLIVEEVTTGGAQHLYWSRYDGTNWVRELIK